MDVLNEDVKGVLVFGLIMSVAATYVYLLKRYQLIPKGAGAFPQWVVYWLVITSIVCLYDASYVLLRLFGSAEHPVWAPYKMYVKVDKLYENLEDDFVVCQSYMNLVEVALNIFALGLLRSGDSKAASVIALMVNTMTGSKTVLYHLMEIQSGFKNTGHNSWATFAGQYLLPNGVWVVVPLYAAWVIGKILAGRAPAWKPSTNKSSIPWIDRHAFTSKSPKSPASTSKSPKVSPKKSTAASRAKSPAAVPRGRSAIAVGKGTLKLA